MAFPFPSTTILDNFNRADANPLDGNWIYPVAPEGGGSNNSKLVSNQLASVAGVSALAWATTYSPVGQEIYMTFPVLSTLFDFELLSDSTGPTRNSYGCGGGTTAVNLFRYDNGVHTNIGNASGLTFANGDVLGMRVEGNDIVFYQNGIERKRATDTTYRPVLSYLIPHIDDTTQRIDNFGGGNPVPVRGHAPLLMKLSRR